MSEAWRDPWEMLRKYLSTIEAAATAGLWDEAEEASAQARMAATATLLAVKRQGIEERNKT